MSSESEVSSPEAVHWEAVRWDSERSWVRDAF